MTSYMSNNKLVPCIQAENKASLAMSKPVAQEAQGLLFIYLLQGPQKHNFIHPPSLTLTFLL